MGGLACEKVISCLNITDFVREMRDNTALKTMQGFTGTEIHDMAKADVAHFLGVSIGKLDADPEKIEKNFAALKPLVTEASYKYQIDETLINAVILYESKGEIAAISSAPAYGVMQLKHEIYDPNPRLQFFKTPVNPFAPEEAVDRGSAFLAYLRDHKYGNDLAKIVAAYNQGEPAVDSAIGKSQQMGGDWKTYLNGEGQKYVKNIYEILSLQNTRGLSHSYLQGGFSMTESGKVSSKTEWAIQHLQDPSEPSSLICFSPYARKI